MRISPFSTLQTSNNLFRRVIYSHTVWHFWQETRTSSPGGGNVRPWGVIRTPRRRRPIQIQRHARPSGKGSPSAFPRQSIRGSPAGWFHGVGGTANGKTYTGVGSTGTVKPP